MFEGIVRSCFGFGWLTGTHHDDGTSRAFSPIRRKRTRGGVNASQTDSPPLRTRRLGAYANAAERQKRPAYGGLTSRLGRVHPWDRWETNVPARLTYACAFHTRNDRGTLHFRAFDIKIYLNLP